MCKNVTNSNLLLFCQFVCVLTICFVYSKYTSNYTFTKQQKMKVAVSKLKDHPKSNSNQKKTSKESYLKQWLNEKEKIYKKDRERIQEICKKYNFTGRKKIAKEKLLVDRTHKMAFCLNSKVGSTTLRQHLEHLMPTKIREKLTVYQYYMITENDILGGSSRWFKIPPDLLNNFITSNKILTASFVRHPFERLVSAYNDKRYNSKKYQGWFKNGKSFSRFVDLVLYEYRKSCYPDSTKASRVLTNWFNNTCEHKINTHWQPFHSNCAYCDVNYDIVGRMETWNDDLNYIIHKRGLEKVLPLQKVKSSHYNPTKQNTSKMTKQYFSKLSKKQKEGLYHMFRIDFELFNYDPKIYL